MVGAAAWSYREPSRGGEAEAADPEPDQGPDADRAEYTQDGVVSTAPPADQEQPPDSRHDGRDGIGREDQADIRVRLARREPSPEEPERRGPAEHEDREESADDRDERRQRTRRGRGLALGLERVPCVRDRLRLMARLAQPFVEGMARVRTAVPAEVVERVERLDGRCGRRVRRHHPNPPGGTIETHIPASATRMRSGTSAKATAVPIPARWSRRDRRGSMYPRIPGTSRKKANTPLTSAIDPTCPEFDASHKRVSTSHVAT